MRSGIVVLCCCLLFFSCENKKEVIPDPTAFSFDLPLHFSNVKYSIPADNPLTNQGVELGRMLFYDKVLSRNNTISCASCHQQQFAFTDNLPLSIGINGKLGKRNSMSIVNLVFQDSTFFWDGRARDLEHQTLFPIVDPVEMDENMENVVLKLKNTSVYPRKFKEAFGTENINSDLIFKALAQFERSIISTNSKFDQYIMGKVQLTAQEKNGFNLFKTHPEPSFGLRGGNCGDCHNTVNFIEQVANFRNNGLDATFTDEGRKIVTGKGFDAGKFRIPSLRNIALTAPYMHDGRFKTLEEVLDHYNEHIQKSTTLDPLIIAASNKIKGTSLSLTQKEKEDIIAFLHTLTDQDLINNTQYSDPFK